MLPPFLHRCLDQISRVFDPHSSQTAFPKRLTRGRYMNLERVSIRKEILIDGSFNPQINLMQTRIEFEESLGIEIQSGFMKTTPCFVSRHCFCPYIYVWWSLS